jgi:alpha-beta hydrolase superfamily lysophospholipase
MKAALQRLRRWWLAPLAALLLVGGCATLDEQQRRWIILPDERSMRWYGGSTDGMQELWITHRSQVEDRDVKLHALWLPQPAADAPVLLYLHGARRTVEGSAFRIRHLHDLGFSVFAVDYRGFGRSSDGVPGEDEVFEDARAAWDWLARNHAGQRRYLYGHSLGGAVAVRLASEVDDAAGLVVEGSFTSIPDVFRTLKWGWLPITPFITQRFDAASVIERVRAPLIVLHGAQDRWILPDLGRRLYERAKVERKQFLLVEGGSHYSAGSVGRDQLREALRSVFGLGGLGE